MCIFPIDKPNKTVHGQYMLLLKNRKERNITCIGRNSPPIAGAMFLNIRD